MIRRDIIVFSLMTETIKNQGRHFRLARLIFVAFSSITAMDDDETGHWPRFDVKVAVNVVIESVGGRSFFQDSLHEEKGGFGDSGEETSYSAIRFFKILF